MTICLYKLLTQRSWAQYGAARATMRPDLDLSKLRASEVARRRTEEERAEAFFPLRATTTAGFLANIAASGASSRTQRDARAARKEGES
jgi:hypothetical protein